MRTSQDRKAFFFSLTAEAVVAAVERAGFALDGTCLALNSFENRVYELGVRDGSRVVAKFYRPARWSPEAILEEHRFLQDLRNGGVPVVEPLVLAGGSTLGEADGILFGVWPKVAGRIVDEPSDEDYGILGRLVARMHDVGASGTTRHRTVLTAEDFLLEPLDFIASAGVLPRHCRERYLGAGRELAGFLAEALRGVPLHRIHGDCHLNNLLRHRGGWILTDFDDFMVGPAVQDLWMLVGGRDREAERRWRLLGDGYRRLREFDDAWSALAEPLRGCRFVRYAAWILRRWEDPVFPRTFPHFGTVEYWEKETEDLEDLVGRILRGGEERDETEAPPEDDLSLRRDAFDEGAVKRWTNKDYFWDWEEPGEES